ncbi:MAG TPA: amidohydrolase family protein [Bacteroidales bacterium]|nr:amidohydrolase family protein [Bacteroidales bacterium]HOX73699.1 amidohydrolase family protein [Bacteroidales bacterium]HPM86503.1 amidohydrolase family protein [Bacteroidales bacterium]HQM68234.1 amidohydrolase family protein [Bacteroidales bacterium]
MRRLSAHFIITNDGPPLRMGIVTSADDGTIISVEDTGGSLKESVSVEFYNGIIIPGFVNCHCHLELSHLKGAIPKTTGLGGFLSELQQIRKSSPEIIVSAASEADRAMYDEGIVLCADICNNASTFSIKKTSRIRYHNLLEVFASDPGLAETRTREIIKLSEESEQYSLPFSIVPHTVYTVSLPLFRLLRGIASENKVTSIHFMETEGEEAFVSEQSGQLMESLRKTGLISDKLLTPRSCTSAILEEVTLSGSLILVHNTFVDRQTVSRINKRGNVYWCLCPNANLYIENRMPPAEMLAAEGCDIVTGTDSLASNERLSILSELKTIQEHCPSISLTDLISWATINGARALGQEDNYGIIGPGKKPGLLILDGIDFKNFKLSAGTFVKRLM